MIKFDFTVFKSLISKLTDPIFFSISFSFPSGINSCKPDWIMLQVYYWPVHLQLFYVMRKVKYFSRVCYVINSGIEIIRSNRFFSCPVCESKNGKYSKTFRFIGWHPQCRCHAVLVVMNLFHWGALPVGYFPVGQSTRLPTRRFISVKGLIYIYIYK